MRSIMTRSNRTLAKAIVAAIGIFATCASGISAADAKPPPYPSRRITVVVPFPPGGSADFFGRSVFTRLKKKIDDPVVVEDKPGAAGIIGSRAVINAKPDGYTLLVSSAVSVNVPPSLTSPRAFDPMKDLAPVTGIGTVPAVLVVRAGLGIKTFAELIEYAKKHPGKLNLASSGVGTLAHLAGALLMREARVQFTHIPYSGAPPAVLDLLGGHADLMFSDAPFFVQYIKSGKLIPLAVGMPQRIPSLPDVPTTAEVGYPSIVASNTYGLFAPRKTPKDIIDKLDKLVLDVLKDPGLKKSFATQEALVAGDTPERFTQLVKTEGERWVPLAQVVVKQK